MNILFCSEGFIIDGVASYNLYLSAALQQAGHRVAILGRWAGFKGFQQRHKDTGVEVIQCVSATADNTWFIKQAVKFQPDILITDSRRSFPLARKARESTGAKLITVFHDPPQLDRTDKRSIHHIMAASDAWVTSEKPIWEELKKIKTNLPTHWIQRPITGMVQPTALPPKDPFNVLCLGRISRWKSPGIRNLVEKATQLKSAIPSLTITVIGGGPRRISVLINAIKANIRKKQRFIRILGTQVNPQLWFKHATVVCAGATSAIEAILSQRPVIAFSGFWMGKITTENMSSAVNTHFGERSGDFYVKDDPDVVIRELIDLYHSWNQEKMTEQVNTLRQQLAPDFDSNLIAESFKRLFEKLNK